MSENFYTPIDSVKKELEKRWADKELEKKVKEYLNGDIPDFLLHKPHVILFRHIISPSNEAKYCLEISKKLHLSPMGLEFGEDRFASFNADKHSLLMMPFYLGKRDNGKEIIYRKRIADVSKSQGKNFSSIKTLWGENLIDFHHGILYEKYPEFKNNVYDMSEWICRNGEKAIKYYEKFIPLLLRNGVLAENYIFTGTEGKFVEQVIAPAIKKTEEMFGVRPLIVRLSPEVSDHNNSWWYYQKDVKDLIDERIKVSIDKF